MFNHVRTRTGGHHNVAGRFFEYANHVFCDGACVCAQTRVEGWLSATGLVAGEVHLHAQAVENVYNGLTGLRVERIDETCHKDLNVRHESIVI